METIKIGEKLIGKGYPVFIIAEAGINHNGNIRLAKKLVDIAFQTKVDAVKFQTFDTDKLLNRKAVKKNYYEILKKTELSYKDYRDLIRYTTSKKILFLSTPFDEESADFLEKEGVLAFKIGSGDMDNFHLLRHIAKKGLPMIISTGMSTMEEVRDAVKVVKREGNQNIALLHCTSSYPTKAKDVNLRIISTLKDIFRLPVGYSDHTRGTIIAVAAVAFGACIIEKHFTLDKTLPGPDHRISLDPFELATMVRDIRTIEKAIGCSEKKLIKSELKVRKTARKSIVAKTDILAGTIISSDMLSIKRPGIGLPPRFINAIEGKKAKRDIKQNEIILKDMIY
jgi:N-acetylneuraminate synthase/N,N'-diacetyllegionaminate synthase